MTSCLPARKHDRFESAHAVGGLLQRLHQLDAVELRQILVADHDADISIGTKLCQCLAAGVARYAFVTIALQAPRKLLNGNGLRINDQNLYC
jgi:hypothetical protein